MSLQFCFLLAVNGLCTMSGSLNHNVDKLRSELLNDFSSFPDNIPSGTAVPHWATLSSAEFDATTAEAAGDSPELTGATQVTSSSAPTSSTSSVSSPSSSSTASSSSKSNTGAIAGGVVGGVVGLALVAAALFWYLRKRSQTRSTVQPLASDNEKDFRLSPDMTGTTHAPTVISHPPLQQKLYDPSDPSTFPTNIMSPTPTHGPNYLQGSSDFGGSAYHHSPNSSLNVTHQNYPGFAEV
ncbi:MAG: hypothetical protein NXY57DRAFT_610676 [Lentinula lateritia]|nr:MAG: hypothetical protein NXY57DRAFT_610676 [Lentinula lateritia]